MPCGAENDSVSANISTRCVVEVFGKDSSTASGVSKMSGVAAKSSERPRMSMTA